MRARKDSASDQIYYVQSSQVVIKFMAKVRLSKPVIHGDKRDVLSIPESPVGKVASL